MRTLTTAFGLALLLGCDGGKPQGGLPPLHPTTGKVVRGDQPVAGGSLQFQPDPAIADVSVSAEVKPDGTFEVQSLHAPTGKKAPGAPAGTYKVTYLPALGDQTQGGGGVPKPVSPAQTYTVKEGPNELVIELGKK